MISIHALLAEGDCWRVRCCRMSSRISIHALLAEGDVTAGAIVKPYTHFYPRPPRGGRLTGFPSLCRRMSNFYPRPPRGGRLIVTESIENYFHIISIHALLAEGDARADGQRDRADHFYPRPPRGGRPLTARQILPASDFYPRPPRGGRPPFDTAGLVKANISIHALLAEGDLRLQSFPCDVLDFYPRPPRGGRPSR